MRFLRRSKASPILKTSEVDLVALSPDGMNYALSMIETRPWAGGDKQLHEVQDKLYAYLDYIEGGQLADEYPDSSEKGKMIILHCAEEPTGDTREFLRLAAEYARTRGVSLEVWPDEPEE